MILIFLFDRFETVVHILIDFYPRQALQYGLGAANNNNSKLLQRIEFYQQFLFN